MSFLLPLFLVGAGAVAAPIIFHLIRREAKGEQVFSSLMFLEASPPTMMRRSRIDHWLLLLLRSLAVLLLVAAFARPFWRSNESLTVSSQSKRVAVVIDRSVSMTRDGLWPAAITKAKAVVENAPAEHVVSLYAFDDGLEPVVSIDSSEGTVPGERKILLIAGLESLTTSQKSSDLGQALATISDELSRDESGEKTDEAVQSEIVLISDFQAGSRIDRLENHQWPANCRLIIARVDSKDTENVSANFLEVQDSDKTSVRLVHRGEQDQPRIDLQWKDDGAVSTEKETPPVAVEVPANSGTVVRISKPSNEASILELRGDQVAFDNRRWFAKPSPRSFQLVCIDDKERETAQNLGYFLEQIPFSNEARKIEFIRREPTAAEPWPDAEAAPLIVSQRRLDPAIAQSLRKQIEKGGHFLWVLDTALDDGDTSQEFDSAWKTLFSGTAPKIYEASDEREAMFGKIDFSSSLFRSLADSRFNDFTKIRFWKHRRVELDEQVDWHVVAGFDDGSPWLAYRRLGQGKVWLMTAGWQPSESQFALSSKFVPIMAALFNESLPPQRSFLGLEVGDRIEVEAGETWFDPHKQEMKPEGMDDPSRRFIFVNEPGFYRVDRDGRSQTVAVNLRLSESDTRMMGIEQLERLGVVTGEIDDAAKTAARSIVRKNRELEKEQSLWRWFMLGVLGLLVVETIWSRKNVVDF